jgi:hypothetical protein
MSQTVDFLVISPLEEERAAILSQLNHRAGMSINSTF